MTRNVPEWEALCHLEYPGLIAAIDVEPIVTITCHDDLKYYDDLIGCQVSSPFVRWQGLLDGPNFVGYCQIDDKNVICEVHVFTKKRTYVAVDARQHWRAQVERQC